MSHPLPTSDPAVSWIHSSNIYMTSCMVTVRCPCHGNTIIHTFSLKYGEPVTENHIANDINIFAYRSGCWGVELFFSFSNTFIVCCTSTQMLLNWFWTVTIVPNSQQGYSDRSPMYVCMCVLVCKWRSVFVGFPLDYTADFPAGVLGAIAAKRRISFISIITKS